MFRAPGIISIVMAGHSASEDARERACVPAIHALPSERKTWMPATSAGMTVFRDDNWNLLQPSEEERTATADEQCEIDRDARRPHRHPYLPIPLRVRDGRSALRADRKHERATDRMAVGRDHPPAQRVCPRRHP